MTFSDETLIAYVDHELDAPTVAALEAAIAHDPKLAARAERQRRLRAAVKNAFDPVLYDPMPARLLAAVNTDAPATTAPSDAKVVDLAASRAETRAVKAQPIASTSSAKPPRRPWLEWGAMAASVALGVVIGSTLLDSSPDSLVASDGQWVARGALAQALTDQLASAQPPSTQPDAGPVRIGLTFVSLTGEYCRTFTLNQQMPLAGLACRSGAQWRVHLVEQQVTPRERESAAPGRYRMAGAGIPPSVLRAVDERIKGNPLDAAAERAARARGWLP